MSENHFGGIKTSCDKKNQLPFLAQVKKNPSLLLAFTVALQCRSSPVGQESLRNGFLKGGQNMLMNIFQELIKPLIDFKYEVHFFSVPW